MPLSTSCIASLKTRASKRTHTIMQQNIMVYTAIIACPHMLNLILQSGIGSETYCISKVTHDQRSVQFPGPSRRLLLPTTHWANRVAASFCGKHHLHLKLSAARILAICIRTVQRRAGCLFASLAMSFAACISCMIHQGGDQLNLVVDGERLHRLAQGYLRMHFHPA